MRTSVAVLIAAVIVMLWVPRLPAAFDYTIVAGPVEDNITFGSLINAPNGHISFQSNADGYRIWLPGRLIVSQTSHLEGGFLLDVPDFTPDDLAAAQATLVLGHDQGDCDPLHFNFDRNYAALNAVVPGAQAGSLIGFYDAEYHVLCPIGQPLLSSIGVGYSTDGGQTWQDRQQAFTGRDSATFGFFAVRDMQLQDGTHRSDDGASGPSAIVRTVGGVPFIYVYYADRTPMTGGDDSIYVARARLESNGATGKWHSWNGSDWGAAGDQTVAAPIVVPAPGGSALQPHVSWNTALQRWLMVFRGSTAFEYASSGDGVHWTHSRELVHFSATDENSGFPTLVSLSEALCARITCAGFSDPNATPPPAPGASQQITNATGWLYYSARATGAKQYVGHRAPYRIQVQ